MTLWPDDEPLPLIVTFGVVLIIVIVARLLWTMLRRKRR